MAGSSRFGRALRTAALCVAVLAAANAAFLALRMADALLPRGPVADALREGFASGAATARGDGANRLVGLDEYTDCVSFQLALLGNEGVLQHALAPRLVSEERVVEGGAIRRARCAEVVAVLAGEAAMGEAGVGATYTRFWHGHATALAAGLTVLPLAGYRALLLQSALLLMALTGVAAALRSRVALAGMAPLLLLSFMFCGQIGFGQLVSYGPAQVACWGMALFVTVRGAALPFRALLLLAVLAGALEAFLDQMIAIPLTAGIFVTTACCAHLPRWGGQGWAALLGAALLAGAWGFGCLGSYAVKLLLTGAVLGFDVVFEPFLQQLRFRVGLAAPDVGMPVGVGWLGLLVLNVLRLSLSVWQLGYSGHALPLAGSAAMVGVAGWGWALWRVAGAWRAGRAGAVVACGAGHLVAAGIMLVWVAAFPEHTWRHLWFMTRGVVLWLAGGWGWALAVWTLAATYERCGVTKEVIRSKMLR